MGSSSLIETAISPGARSITIYGQDVWDAGTEINAVDGGAAFSTEGGVSSDENGRVHRHEGLDDFVGSGTPVGTLQGAFAEMTPIARITISLADQQAEPIDLQAPLATADVADVLTADQATHEVRVTYSDASGVDLASIDTNDLVIANTVGGSPLPVTGVSLAPGAASDARTVTAIYEVSTVDAENFSPFTNGLYEIELVPGEVGDVFGNEVGGDSLGSFEILVPVELTITIENLAVDGGLYQTPFWIAVHEGNFLVARAGAEAGDFGGLEDLAEGGDVSGVAARFASESSGVDGCGACAPRFRWRTGFRSWRNRDADPVGVRDQRPQVL